MRHATVTTVLEAPRDEVFDFMADIENVPRWATEFARELKREPDGYRVVNGLGEFRFEIRADRDTGVIDMYAGPDANQLAVFRAARWACPMAAPPTPSRCSRRPTCPTHSSTHSTSHSSASSRTSRRSSRTERTGVSPANHPPPARRAKAWIVAFARSGDCRFSRKRHSRPAGHGHRRIEQVVFAAGGWFRPPQGAGRSALLSIVVIVADPPAGAQPADGEGVHRGAAAVSEQFDPVAGGGGEDLVGDDGLAAVGEDLD